MEPTNHARRDGAATTLLVVASIACVAVGIARAAGSTWVTDDAFISFRYARNLVEGSGLVFNPGERVEGYTNFLWTAWSALGIASGFDPLRLALVSGGVAYAGSIALLALYHASLCRAMSVTRLTLPAGALVAVLIEEWSRYATGGLETSAFALLNLIGFVCLAGRDDPGPRRLLAAGAAFALASMTRPDGVVFAAVAAAWIVAVAPRSRGRSVALYGLGFLALWAPFTIWRVTYYGDWFPNTYHAKSAYLAWYAQGWQYLRLFLVKYWILLAVPPLLALGALALRRADGFAVWARQALLAGAFVVAYTLYVVRVGGDFMFGRLLVPTLPFWAVLFDLGLLGLTRRRALYWAALAGIAAAFVWTPSPIEGLKIVHGIADEPRHYSREAVERVDRDAQVLRRYFEGLDVTVGFTGSEARLVYRARIPRAIECETGLTDRAIARQPLERRGRPGHEKHARLDYLVDERGTDFVLNPHAFRIVGAAGRIPPVTLELDHVRLFLLRWNPELLAELARRGARVPDFPATLDRVIDELPGTDRDRVARMYAELRRFYFDHADDPSRGAAFERRLGLPPDTP
jgi:arabinofuranosyltransferase